ncbi:MAG: O-phospho-L-seryl-tRNA:Cys-tRNA synthase [Candidatus Altiarchaeales archaeon ex4484_96]|nr:MAG: O-phospho-L-seryl-tRNA:Cys-tRNA synthase [Candidatus Altiarchaeales archaeon ex4484_96]
MAEIPISQLDRLRDLKRSTGGFLNLNPIQRGGILTPEARKAVLDWADGYSICDFCDGVLECIKKPPVDDFVHKTMTCFIGADHVRLTNGAREAMYMVMHAVCKPGDVLLLDANSHYSAHIAAERHNLWVYEIPNNGYPEYKINEELYADKIEEIKRKTKKNPALALITYPDGNYGNLPDARKIAKICSDYDVPLLVNAAYAMGRMPVSLKHLKADFIVGSGHKSMACSGPIGVLGLSESLSDVVLRKSKNYKNKEVEMLGCGPRGLPLITLMASFPKVYERVKHWDDEIKKARYFIDEIEKIEGIKQLGVKPTQHDLNFLETKVFHRISEKHKKGGFFLYRELKKRNIIGVKPGLSKNFKLSTYGFKKDEIKKIIEAFKEIVQIK